MNGSPLCPILSAIHAVDEYEQLKLQNDVLEKIAKEIIQRHRLPDAPLTIFAEGTNIVFALGKNLVIKIYPPFHHEQFQSELLILKHLQGKLSVKTPAIQCYGELLRWPYLVMAQLDGVLLEGLWETLDHNNKMILVRELGSLIKEVHALSTHGLETIDCHWKEFIDKQINHCIAHHTAKLSESLLQQIPAYLEPIKPFLQEIKTPVILTGEYTPMNFLVKQKDGVWHIDGLIDFGDAMLGHREYDLLGPGAFLIQGDKQLLRTFLIAYGYSPEALTRTLSQQLTALMLLHKYSNLGIQIRIKNWQDKVHNLIDLENLVWGF